MTHSIRTLTQSFALSLSLLPAAAQAQTALTTAPASQPTTQPVTQPTTQLTAGQQAAQAAAEARDLAARARTAYPQGSANIDQTLWKEAAAAADRAVQAAPNNPDYLRLRAQIYTEVGFWAAAQSAWDAYFRAAPNETDGSAAKQAALVQYNLGYASYTRNQPDQAARYFAACLEQQP